MSLKKQTFLLISLIVCISLFATYFIITSLPEKENGSEGSGDSYIYISQNDTDSITGFSFKGGEYDLSFEKDKNGVWKYSENKTLPVNTAFIETRLEDVELFVAVKLISDSADGKALSEYGLDTAAYTLRLSTLSGEKIYLFGDMIKSKGLYYMTEKGSGNIWLVEGSYVESFSHDVFDFLSTDTLETLYDVYVEEVKILCGAYSEILTPDGVEGSDTSRLISALCSIELTRCVDFGSEKFSIYGLGEDEAINVYINHSGKTVSYKFGLGETEEFIYLLVENSDSEFSEMVYLFSASDFEHLYSYLSDAFEGRSEQ